MTSMSRPCSSLRRRALARISRMPSRRRVVDEHLGVVQPRERLDQPRVVLLAEEPAAEPVRIDARLGRQHAHEQLLLRHLEAEDADGLAGLDAAVQRHVQHEARLAHRRPRRDDDQVRLLEARRHLVEIDEPARHAGDEALVLLQLLDQLVAGVDQLADAARSPTRSRCSAIWKIDRSASSSRSSASSSAS